MSFLLFILLMAVVMIITPLFGTFLKIYRQTRRMRNMFRDFGASGFGSNEETSQRSRGGWTYPLRRKKKVYSREDGEYVDFKEVNMTETTTETKDASGTHRTYTREQQITDVEWEEIS